jgi:hypothetical protein
MAGGGIRNDLTFGTKIKSQQTDIKTLFSMLNSTYRVAAQQGGFRTGTGSPSVVNDLYLRVKGGTMQGAIAFAPRIITLTSSKLVDIAQDTDDFTSRLIISNGGAFELKFIDGGGTNGQAQFNGQLLFLQGVLTETIVIVNNNGNGDLTDGNIDTLSGSNFTLTGDEIIMFQFDSTSAKWKQITNGNSIASTGWTDSSVNTSSGVKTFLDTTMKLRNVANTFDAYFVHTATADRIFTLPDVGGSEIVVSPMQTDLDANSLDIDNVDRLLFTDSAGSFGSTSDTGMVRTSTGLASNVPTGDEHIFRVEDVQLSLIGQFGGSNDTIVTSESAESATAFFRTIRRDTTPSAGAAVGGIEFWGVDSTGTQDEQFARILVDAEDLTVGAVDGSMHFQVEKASLPVTFISLNNSNDNLISIWKNMQFQTGIDLEMEGNDILLESSGNAFIVGDSAGVDIHADGSGDSVAMHVDGVVQSFSATGLQLGATAELDLVHRALLMTATSATFLADGYIWHDSADGKLKGRENSTNFNLNTAGGGGATTELDNLGTTAVNAIINMGANNLTFTSGGDIVLNAGFTLGQLFFDGVAGVGDDTYITGSGTAGRINVVSEGVNTFGFLPTNLVILTDAQITGDFSFTDGTRTLDMNRSDIIDVDNMSFDGALSGITGLDDITMVGTGSTINMANGLISNLDTLDMNGAGSRIQDLDDLDFQGAGSTLVQLDTLTLFDSGSIFDMNLGDIVDGGNIDVLDVDCADIDCLDVVCHSLIRSGGATEIGIFVTNDTGTIGGFGTVQIPTDTGGESNSATADTDFGAFDGAIGLYERSGGVSPFFCVRSNGVWYGTLMTLNI